MPLEEAITDTPACPQCHLPKEEHAWRCDGCGCVFRHDLAQAGEELAAELRSARRSFWLWLCSGLAIAGGLVYLAFRGWVYISIPLMLAMIGGVGHAAHRVSVLRGHVRSLPRRHQPPVATAGADEP